MSRSRGGLATPGLAALRDYATTLLDAASPRSALERAATALHALLLDAAGLDDEADGGVGTSLPSGRALSPLDAARCTRDPARTAGFLRGLNAAVDTVDTVADGRPVEVLYPGTGPLAPFALLLLSLRRPGELRFTLVDVHERSVRSVGRLVERFGFGPFVRTLLAADATRLELPAGPRFDVLVVEAMQRSLAVEPQVALVRRLAPLLWPGGLLVPARIALDLVLSDPAVETDANATAERRTSVRLPVATLFELTKESASAPLDRDGRLPPVAVTLPSGTDRTRTPMLFTRIGLFGPHVLDEGESGLTTPEVLWPLSGLPAGARLAFRYQLGPSPGLTWERICRAGRWRRRRVARATAAERGIGSAQPRPGGLV